MGYRLRTFGNADSYREEDYLNAALQIYDWIENNRKDGEDGVYYRVNPGAAIEFTEHAVHGKYGLYSGSAGIGLYLLRLLEATGDNTYLQEAEQVAEELIRHIPGSEFYEEKLKTAMQSELKVTGWHTGVYTGPAGAGIFALELYRIKPLEKYKAFAVKLGEDILKAGRKVTLNKTEETVGLTLSGDTDVFSDGGFVLYFLSLYQTTKEERFLTAAREFAAYIYSTGVKTPEGIFFYANDLAQVGMPRHSIYPGFAHGTAGIGYILAVLYSVDKQEWELRGAEETAAFLSSISDRYGEGRLIPYNYGGEATSAGKGTFQGEVVDAALSDRKTTFRREAVGAAAPDGGSTEEEFDTASPEYYKGKYYLGFCHGPAGTSFLYRKLYELTGQEKYLTFYKELAQGIIEAGAPEYNSWGFWNSYCTCCGTPGLIEFFTDAYEFTGDAKYLEYAKRSATRTIGDSTYSKEGRLFYGSWDRTDPKNVQTFTGLYTGAAGAGANLLRLYAHYTGKKLTPLWEYGYLGKQG